MKIPRPLTPRWLAGAALLLGAATASAHLGYTGRDFGTLVPGGPPVSLASQSVSGSHGWADGTDADFGDSHKLRPYRFTLPTSAYVTVTFSGSTNGGAHNGGLKPAFSIYRGLAHLPPLTSAPGSPDYDTSPITLAYLATLPGGPKEGAFRALGDWRVGGENQTGPVFDFDAADGLSTFVYQGHAADGDATLYGDAPGINGDGNADGTVTRSLFLPAGDYTIFVGGANYAGQAPTPDATTYGLVGTVSAAVFTHVKGDPADGGIGYTHQVTVGPKSAGQFSGHVGAWSWEDNELFGPGEPTVGWTHTSQWLALRVEQDMNLTVTLSRDANVPWPSVEDPDRKADTTSMFPSFTLWRGWDNDGGDHHSYSNRGNVDWAEDLSYVDHADNSTEATVTRTYFLRAGDYTLALGSNAPATNPNRQGYQLQLATTEVVKADPVQAAGGIGYTHTVVADADTSGSFRSHVGAWSWEDNALFGQPNQGTQPVGWTHTSNWLALRLTEEAFFTLTLERDADVPWPSVEDPDRKADTTSLFPSLTLWRGWDNDGGDHHSYNNRGPVAWAEDLRYLDHVDNSTDGTLTRTWRLPAGEYTFALGSNAPATNPNRQGYKASFRTQAAGGVVDGDPAAGGIGYAHTLSIGRGDSGSFANHVGAWSWEDDSLFDAGEGDAPVGWTHTSRWVAVHVKDHLRLNLTVSRDANVAWAGAPAELDGKADTASMFPSFTLWRGWDNDGDDHHTYRNRGDVDWAEDLSYLDHCDNSTDGTITRSYTLAPGCYTFALGSNAPATNTNRQGFRFSWTTAAPALEPPVITLQPKPASVLAGKKAGFSVKAVGPDLEYQWFRNGQPLAGATDARLSLTGISPDQAGDYTCSVRNAAGWAHSQAAELVVIAKPVVEPFDLPDLVIGQPFELQLSASNAPVRFAVKGLPKGLAVHPATGRIHGRPLQLGAAFTVEVVASNAAGASAPVTDTFAVTGLPAGLAGSYAAPLGRSLALNRLLGGSLHLQVTGLGSLTGTLKLGSAAPLRLASPLDTSAASPTARLQIARPGLPPLQLDLVVDALHRSLFGTLSDGTETLPFVARPPLDELASYPGDYTLALRLTGDELGQERTPQGHGIGAFKIGPGGLATGVLQLADGTPATFGGPLEDGGGLTLFSPLYKGAGSVLGLLQLQAADQDLALSEVSWFKGGVAKDLAYRDGFGPLDLEVVGRKYTIPAADALPLGLEAGPGNAALSFAEGGAPDPATRLNTDRIEVQARTVVFSAPNPAKLKLTLNAGQPGKPFVPGRTGSFTGSFELTDTDTSVTPHKPLVRKAAFQGMIVDDGAGPKGYGFFLLPKLPTASPKTTLANSPRLSGRVELQAD